MKVLIAGEMPFLQEIGQLCVTAGHDTHLYLVEDFLSAEEGDAHMEELTAVDIAIELHHETAVTKQHLLAALTDRLPDDALILASALNSSVTQAAAWCRNPARVAGFGVLPPLEAGGLVEIAAGLQTADDTMSDAAAFWQSLDLDPVEVGDGPGLIRARLVCAIINEAADTLLHGVAAAEDIDTAMQLGANYPLGPLAWGDLIGLDTVLGVMSALFDEWGEDRYRPSPLLKRMVLAGRLGQKTGHGFYKYE